MRQQTGLPLHGAAATRGCDYRGSALLQTQGLLLGDHLVTMGVLINPWGAMMLMNLMDDCKIPLGGSLLGADSLRGGLAWALKGMGTAEAAFARLGGTRARRQVTGSHLASSCRY